MITHTYHPIHPGIIFDHSVEVPFLSVNYIVCKLYLLNMVIDERDVGKTEDLPDRHPGALSPGLDHILQGGHPQQD